VFTIQVALEGLRGGPLGGRSGAVHRHGRHPEGVLGAALQTWTGEACASELGARGYFIQAARKHHVALFLESGSPSLCLLAAHSGFPVADAMNILKAQMY